MAPTDLSGRAKRRFTRSQGPLVTFRRWTDRNILLPITGMGVL